jgi:hypothetical protein
MIRHGALTAVRVVLLVTLIAAAGCQTGGQTGALGGAGIGALAGQAIGGDTGATLIGAAVGTGIGYIIGNEADKKHAREMSRAQPSPAPTHSEVGPLGGTRWSLISLVPKSVVSDYASKVVEFKPNGRVITTTTKPDGSVEVYDEAYRVVGDTLIINKPGYLVNARFAISGNQLTVSAEEFSAVLTRL